MDKLPDSIWDRLPYSTVYKQPDITGGKLPDSIGDKLSDSTGDWLPDSTGDRLTYNTQARRKFLTIEVQDLGWRLLLIQDILHLHMNSAVHYIVTGIASLVQLLY